MNAMKANERNSHYYITVHSVRLTWRLIRRGVSQKKVDNAAFKKTSEFLIPANEILSQVKIPCAFYPNAYVHGYWQVRPCNSRPLQLIFSVNKMTYGTNHMKLFCHAWGSKALIQDRSATGFSFSFQFLKETETRAGQKTIMTWLMEIRE